MTLMRGGPSPERAKAGLVMLHGRGSSARDMFELADAVALPEVAKVAPEAPGNSWWPTSFLAQTSVMEPYVQRALEAVRGAVATLESEGMERRRIWLLGFSQGACLALEAFAREGDGLAGAIALSGGLIGTSDDGTSPDPAYYGNVPKKFSYGGGRAGSDVWLSCHARDPHIPLARVDESGKALQRLGAKVEVKVYPGTGHRVMPEDVTAICARLNV